LSSPLPRPPPPSPLSPYTTLFRSPPGSASLQLAFKVGRDDVDRCAAELTRKGIALTEPPTDQPFGHRTLFFRDPERTGCGGRRRSEEHTSELQSRFDLVCRLLLEK